MALRVEIPVLANSVGTHARVDMAVTLNGATPPAESSVLWQLLALVPNGDLPTTVLSQPVSEGTFVWSRASAQDGEHRASAYSTPVVTAVVLLPGFLSAELVLGEGETAPHTVSWAPNLEAGGVRVRWGVDSELTSQADVDATDETFQIPDQVLPNQTLIVELQAFETFAAGSVGGTAGHQVSPTAQRPGVLVPGDEFDPMGDFACRITFDNEDFLIYDNDHCLVLALPG